MVFVSTAPDACAAAVSAACFCASRSAAISADAFVGFTVPALAARGFTATVEDRAPEGRAGFALATREGGPRSCEEGAGRTALDAPLLGPLPPISRVLDAAERKCAIDPEEVFCCEG